MEIVHTRDNSERSSVIKNAMHSADVINVIDLAKRPRHTMLRVIVNLLNEDKYYSTYKQTDGMYKVDNVKLNDIRIIFDSSMVGKTYTASCNLNCPNTVSAVSLETNFDGKKKLGNNILTNNSCLSKITLTPKTVRDSIKFTYGTGSGGIIFSDFQIC